MCQRAFDAFCRIRKLLMDRLAYASICLFGIEDCTLADVQRGGYKKKVFQPLNLNEAKEAGMLLEIAKESFEAERDRRSRVTDKCKTLQTVSAFLLGLLALFLPKAYEFKWLYMQILVAVAVLLLVNAVILIFVFLAVREETAITFYQEEVGLDETNLKKAMINSYGECAVAAENRTDYLVDVYQVSRFFFLFALTMIILLFGVSLFVSVSSTDVQKTIEQLRGDRTLINLLKGPPGDPGKDGKDGSPGKDGKDGAPGQMGGTARTAYRLRRL